MESTDTEENPTAGAGRVPRRRERVGPGGDPVVTTDDGGRPAEGAGVVLDCGWGRLVFGQTFADPSDAADVLRDEMEGSRDICMYLEDPHVLVSRRPDELFIDPSLTYRLALPLAADPDDGEVPGLTIRLLRDEADAEVVNGIYARNGMVTAPVDVLVENAATPEFVHLVAELAGGQLVGTITGVDHVAVFAAGGAPVEQADDGSSLWCLTVDPNLAPPGTGQALLLDLAHRLADRGRRWLDLSVLADNTGAIRLYERLGFERTPTLCVKRKNPINERLFVASLPEGYESLNPYATIIADEAMRRGIRVEVIDPVNGELRLTHAGRSIVTVESLSELTTAVAMFRCDDKRITRRILAAAGLRVPRARDASGDEDDARFLAEVGTVVVKPTRGEQGQGITVGVSDPVRLSDAVAEARRYSSEVLIEELAPGDDLRVIVIDHQVVAAAVRRPASVTGDGVHTVEELIERQSRRREAATGGESSIPLDANTRDVVRDAGHELEEVLPEGEVLAVRRTANLHTGGTIHDVTAHLHPVLADACIRASEALNIPVTGLDLMVPVPDGPDYVFIEANERPGLANHEPQPTAERFVDLLFPGTSAPPKLWTPGGATGG
ncbi:N-acetylglutaminylglutamine synthetase [Spongisporangium articulatum]|uniref:N-acetylglutaminylglutamine synthetase n=1 Tax=Spongisporangium articulatum TaxID=3362603 RepID=A0ABW8ARU3_9ACTN